MRELIRACRLPAALLTAICWLTCEAHATEQPAIGADPARDRPVATAVRIEVSEAPVIDADLSDLAWAKATLITEFYQTEPNTGAPGTERTELRIMYDENNFYFGVYSYESMPDSIIMRSMARDGPIYTGDMVGVTLDPGMTRRNAYSFQISPSGGRADALLLNNSTDLNQWDPIWEARARVVENGWVAEWAIPFRSLSYEPGQSDWGFDFQRDIRHKNEEVFWSSINPNLESMDVSQAGTLTGITGVSQGVGLDIQVYGAGKVKRDWHIPGEDTGFSFTGGANAFYRLTPALTGTLTFNPDFSDAPLDARQVNTSRFSLFFPETRDFFLQDAGAFEFGGRGFTRARGNRAVNNGQPFFSRNIGLADGQPVSIIGGGKVSGETGGFGIGLLSVLTEASETAGRQVLSSARLSRRIFDESQFGLIFTDGDPTGATDNRVAGGDFQYRTSDFLGSGNVFSSDFYYQRSFSSAFGDDDAFGFAVNFPNEPWGGNIAFKELGANYDPALGFVNRAGIRIYEAYGAHLTRNNRDSGSMLRLLQFSTSHFITTDLRDAIQSREDGVAVQATTMAENTFSLGATNYFEAVPMMFDLPGDIAVPVGDYDWTNIKAGLQTANNRPLSVRADIECCRFYNGDSILASAQGNFRPNQYYELASAYEFQRLDMAGGSAGIHVLRTSGTVNFTPDMQLALQMQYDNISKALGFLARYRWEFLPGDELLIALGQAGEIDSTGLEVQRSLITVRVGHTFRF